MRGTLAATLALLLLLCGSAAAAAPRPGGHYIVRMPQTDRAVHGVHERHPTVLHVGRDGRRFVRLSWLSGVLPCRGEGAQQLDWPMEGIRISATGHFTGHRIDRYADGSFASEFRIEGWFVTRRRVRGTFWAWSVHPDGQACVLDGVPFSARYSKSAWSRFVR